MSTQDITTEIEFMDNESNTIAVVDDEAYNLSGTDVAFHENEEGLILITAEDAYLAEYDEDDWLIVSEDTPEFVLEALEENELRYADAEAYGFPVEINAGFRSDDVVYDSAWRQEKLRPSMDIMERINTITEVTLELEVSEDGEVRVTDLSLWPTASNVTVDI